MRRATVGDERNLPNKPFSRGFDVYLNRALCGSADTDQENLMDNELFTAELDGLTFRSWEEREQYIEWVELSAIGS